MAIAFIGLGSNLGDRLNNLRESLDRVLLFEGFVLDGADAAASVYETSPVGMEVADPPFLNTAVRICCALSAMPLLDHLLAVEASMGRKRGLIRGSRPIDLDLLLFDEMAVREPTLTVPHPRLHQRRFVLEPLAEIAPDARHPQLGQTIRELALNARAGQPSQTVIRVLGRKWYCGRGETGCDDSLIDDHRPGPELVHESLDGRTFGG